MPLLDAYLAMEPFRVQLHMALLDAYLAMEPFRVQLHMALLDILSNGTV